MWKPNGIRQRIILALVALLLIAGGAVVALSSWESTENGLAQTRIIDTLPATMPELGIYVAIVLALISTVLIFVVVSALPKKPGRRTFIYHSENSTGISKVDSGTISTAAEEAAENNPEIDSADIRINGTTNSPVLYARFTLRGDTHPMNGMDKVRNVLIPQMEHALGVRFTEKYVNIDFSAKKSESSAGTTLR